jgi:hypothetical protein
MSKNQKSEIENKISKIKKKSQKSQKSKIDHGFSVTCSLREAPVITVLTLGLTMHYERYNKLGNVEKIKNQKSRIKYLKSKKSQKIKNRPWVLRHLFLARGTRDHRAHVGG